VEANVVTQSSLPAPLHVVEKDKQKDKPTDRPGDCPAGNLADLSLSDGSVHLTVEWVRKRLGFDAPVSGMVLVSDLKFLGKGAPCGAEAGGASADEEPRRKFLGAVKEAGGGDEEGVKVPSKKEKEDKNKVDVYKATLINLELATQEDTLSFPSGVKAFIKYGAEEFVVDSDCLRAVAPAAKPTEEAKEKVETMLPFEWDNLTSTVTRRVALFALDEAFIQAFDATKHIEIDMVGEKRFRVRATKNFAVGELVLIPFALQDTDCSLINRKDLAAHPRFAEPDLSQMDKDAVHRCYIKVLSKEKRQRRKDTSSDAEKSNAVTEVFCAHSPLFWRKSSQQRGVNVAQDMSPLWAVPRSINSREVNMKFENIIFDVSPIAAIGRKMPNATKAALWSVSIQCLTNLRKVQSGDFLATSVMRVDADDDGQEE